MTPFPEIIRGFPRFPGLRDREKQHLEALQ